MNRQNTSVLDVAIGKHYASSLVQKCNPRPECVIVNLPTKSVPAISSFRRPFN